MVLNPGSNEAQLILPKSLIARCQETLHLVCETRLSAAGLSGGSPDTGLKKLRDLEPYPRAVLYYIPGKPLFALWPLLDVRDCLWPLLDVRDGVLRASALDERLSAGRLNPFSAEGVRLRTCLKDLD